MNTGGAHGFPVVNVRVECYDGKYHSVDSSDMAFKNAAASGFKEALGRAGAVVLEPISMLKVTIPSSYQGDVLADLTTRRGRVVGTSAGEHGEQEVSALVPTSEIIRYALDLRSITAGRGRFVATHDHDEILPNNLVSKVVKAATSHTQPSGSGLGKCRRALVPALARRPPSTTQSSPTSSPAGSKESSCRIVFVSESSWHRFTRRARTRRWPSSVTST